MAITAPNARALNDMMPMSPDSRYLAAESMMAFGAVIATISCGWGQTTTGGAKGVGESTTASVVISLVAIFVVDFFISLTWFQR